MDDPLSTTGNHLTREIKAAFCDAMTGQNGQEQIDRIPRIYSRLGRPGQPRRAARRPDRRGREHDRGRPGLFLRRHRSRAGTEGDRRPRSAPAGHVLDARPLRGRLRLGDHEQGDRHHRRRRVRQGRAGLSEVRLGEEGPADDVLPDDRRASTSCCTASWSTSTWSCSTTPRRCSAATRWTGWFPAGRSSCSRRMPSRTTSGSGFPSTTSARFATQAAGVLRRHGADRPRRRVGGRPADAHAGHRAAWEHSSS